MKWYLLGALGPVAFVAVLIVWAMRGEEWTERRRH